MFEVYLYCIGTYRSFSDSIPRVFLEYSDHYFIDSFKDLLFDLIEENRIPYYNLNIFDAAADYDTYIDKKRLPCPGLYRQQIFANVYDRENRPVPFEDYDGFWRYTAYGYDWRTDKAKIYSLTHFKGRKTKHEYKDEYGTWHNIVKGEAAAFLENREIRNEYGITVKNNNRRKYRDDFDNGWDCRSRNTRSWKNINKLEHQYEKKRRRQHHGRKRKSYCAAD